MPEHGTYRLRPNSVRMIMQRTRFPAITLVVLAAMLIAGCKFWPRDLEPLADSISRQLSGETTAWLAAGDVVLIDVAGSPSYWAPQEELEALATGIAEQAIGFIGVELESIAIAFHEGVVSDDPDHTREFIFLVMEGRPVLQSGFDAEATGPLTADEIRLAADRIEESYDGLGKPLAEEHRECIQAEMEQRAREAGDPETLDPANVEFLDPETWAPLDAFGKRLILTQAISSQALFVCASTISNAADGQDLDF